MAAGERLPEEHADRPDVRGAVRLLPGQPLGGDVPEGSRHVSGGGERVRLFDPRQAEVEQADGELVALLDHDVRRLDVAVDDALGVRVRERVQHLRGDFDRRPVVDRAAPERLAQRPAGDVG